MTKTVYQNGGRALWLAAAGRHTLVAVAPLIQATTTIIPHTNNNRVHVEYISIPIPIYYDKNKAFTGDPDRDGTVKDF